MPDEKEKKLLSYTLKFYDYHCLLLREHSHGRKTTDEDMFAMKRDNETACLAVKTKSKGEQNEMSLFWRNRKKREGGSSKFFFFLFYRLLVQVNWSFLTAVLSWKSFLHRSRTWFPPTLSLSLRGKKNLYPKTSWPKRKTIMMMMIIW